MNAAVMFDCDGVLVESETLIARILVRMTNALGGELSLAEGLRLFHGAHLDLCARRISEHLGRDVTADITAEYHRCSAEIFRRELTAVDGVGELLRALTLPSCVVSNSSREKMILNLEVTGLFQHFGDRVYSACDLSRWKPEPDIYLHAAERLGVDPCRCIAIEDSATGVQSAARAGMAVIGFGSRDGAAELRRSGARWICRTMNDVREVIHGLTHPSQIPKRTHPTTMELNNTMPEHGFQEKGVISTLNQRGHTSRQLGEYSRRFVDSLSTCTAPVLDIGAAYGVCTLPALATGATVIACDIEPRHLDALVASCPEADCPRLIPLIAAFPDGPHLADNSIGAIHAANLLNYLTGAELVRGTELLFRILRPGGQVFTVSGTPYAANVKEFIPIYEANRSNGAEWPGEAYRLRTLCAHPSIQDLPDFLHLLDDQVLTRVFEQAGFVVDEAVLYERSGLSDYLRWDGRENVGLIARKP